MSHTIKSREKIVQICDGENINPIILTSKGRILGVVCYSNWDSDGNFLGYTSLWKDITPNIEKI